MVSVTYDFAILGDGQPEGLVAAAGLVRKGFSVVIVPSPALGELPSDQVWPLVLPAQIGTKRLDDLLFRAGFFRLEESGLVASTYQTQVILPKHRLLFNGTRECWEAEVQREFPNIASALSKLWDSAKKATTPAHQNKVIFEVADLIRKNPPFQQWVEAEVRAALHPLDEVNPKILAKHWVQLLLQQVSKSYRVDPKLRQPYTTFLLEHARKWGAQVWSEPVQLKRLLSGFQLSGAAKARQVILNGLGSGRVLAKYWNSRFNERMQYWLHFDQVEVPLAYVPEPLEEFCQVDYQDKVADLPSFRVLHTHRDKLRDTATVSIGSWLPFDDSKMWIAQIEKGRQVLRKVIPYLPKDCFKPAPSLLELTEYRGECIRRGLSDRLIPMPRIESRWERFVGSLKNLFRPAEKFMLGRRIYAVTPHYLSFRNRMTSFEQCLHLLDFFDKKRRKFSNT